MRHLLALAVVSFLAWPAAAQDAHAGRHSADAVAYVEVDGGALLDGLGKLDVIRLLDDPEMRAFLKPTFQKLGLDENASLADFLKKQIPGTAFSLKDWLPGKVSFALYGVTLRIEGAGLKKPKVLRLNASNPLAAKQVLTLLGQVATAEIAGIGAYRLRYYLALDFSAVLEPGPRLKQLLLSGTRHAAVNTKKIKLAGREVLHIIDAPERIDAQSYFKQHYYADVNGDKWIVASSPERFEAAANRAVRRPLEQDPGYIAVRRRFAADQTIIFAWGDVAKAAKALESAISPLFHELSQKAGLASVKGLGWAVSISNGGVRESFGFVLDGQPTGVWRLLDAFPGGLQSVQVAPPGALAVVALKFDAALFVKRLHEVAADLLPGTEDLLVGRLAHEFQRETGLDFQKDLLAAFGDEAAVLVYPGMPFPDAVFGLEIRDVEAFGRVLALAKKHAQAFGVGFDDVQLTETIKGTQVSNPNLPLPLTFAIARNHLFLSTNKNRVVEALTKWGTEGQKSLGTDGDVFKAVMKGLTGGETDNLVALAYVNARGLVKASAAFLPMVAPQLPPEWFNRGRFPKASTLMKYLKGVAFGIRRDADGVTLDSYSPLGLLTPGFLSGFFFAAAQPVRVRRARAVIVQPQRGADLGVLAMRSSGNGVVVLGMSEQGPAVRAGLRTDDKIVAFGKTPIRTIDELNDAVAKCQSGQKVKLKVVRDDRELEIVIVPTAR